MGTLVICYITLGIWVFKKFGVKIITRLLIELAIISLLDPITSYTTIFHDSKDNVLLIEKLTNSWIQKFMFMYNINFYHKEGI